MIVSGTRSVVYLLSKMLSPAFAFTGLLLPRCRMHLDAMWFLWYISTRLRFCGLMCTWTRLWCTWTCLWCTWTPCGLAVAPRRRWPPAEFSRREALTPPARGSHMDEDIVYPPIQPPSALSSPYVLWTFKIFGPVIDIAREIRNVLMIKSVSMQNS